MKLVALLSGGMDSVVAMHAATREHQVVAALSFHYGSKHNDREIPCARWQAERLGIRHEIVALDFMGELFQSHLLKNGGEIPKGHYQEATMKQTVVPLRNGIMLTVAAGFAESIGADGVLIAAHAGDHAIYPDCRENFMSAMAEAIRLGTYAGIQLVRPFIAAKKSEIVSIGHHLGVDFSHTWSCYVGGPVHCGECGTCIERREAFLLAGVPDPTEYAHQGPLPPSPATC